jgi:hypothetical protein
MLYPPSMRRLEPQSESQGEGPLHPVQDHPKLVVLLGFHASIAHRVHKLRHIGGVLAPRDMRTCPDTPGSFPGMKAPSSLRLPAT